MENRPFEGLKVLDFTWGGVGPFHANFLSYYGAMVVRIESAARPDVTRHSRGLGEPEGSGGLEQGPVFALTHPVKKYGMSL
ncbi:MAG: CoA transferase, partial [Dehalococcoidales bacterium]